jgi:prepilin-type N-terminal cleavage/methylation domain-containing protein
MTSDFFSNRTTPERRGSEDGFTLTELLVVIAVIGLLGSTIFAITRGAGEQGRIAKGHYFSQHLQNSLGSYLAGRWSFDEGSGTVVNDTSGWDNNGTLVNSPTWRCASVDPSYTPSGQGCSLEFGYGSNRRVEFANGSVKSLQSHTISLWGKRQGAGANWPRFFLNGTVNTSITLTESNSPGDGGILYRLFIGGAKDIQTAEKPLMDGSWHHIAATYDGSSMKLYLDGVLRWQKDQTGTINTAEGETGFIGGEGTSSFSGLVDDIRIYDRALTAVEIQQRYVEGLERLQLAKR